MGSPGSADVDRHLAELAAEFGVATSYEDWAGRPVPVEADVVVQALAALGVDAGDPAAALAAARQKRARRLLPPTVVAWTGVEKTFDLPGAGAGAEPVGLTVELEDGGRRELRAAGGRVTLPGDLPAGWHRLTATAGGRTAGATLVVAPPRLDPPVDAPLWGWQVQLYAMRSARSWGLGDYGDLAEVARRSGAEQGAGAVLVNPLHAFTPGRPVQPSPYYPSSRQFRSPLYLRVEDTAEYAALDPDVRAEVDRIGDRMRATNRSERLDRDAVWAAKLAALELLFPASREPGRAAALAAFTAERGTALRDFATYCALAESYGPTWPDWPAELHRPDTPEVVRARVELAERVEFHSWLQLLCDSQLEAVQRAARAAGMPLGVIHDLAVGVDPAGADAWALQDVLAGTTTVGAPPDSFNQQGQDWRLPPWRPDRLAELGYAPFRDMLRAVLRHAGGIRIDHILGLFRLWWVPDGEPASRGTYVRYDDEALLAVLALEAHRAGALVVGEDLGTVEPRVAETLERRRVLGSDVLWFARDVADDGTDAGPLPPQRWRELAAASVTTHDLPTSAGFLAAEHVRVRAELGVLGRPQAEEQAQADRERAELTALARRVGLVGPEPSDEELVVAFHALLGRTPARLVLAYPGDAVGDLRQPNLPGTVDEYPNWRLPLADRSGRPLLLDEVLGAPLAERIAAALDRRRAGDADPADPAGRGSGGPAPGRSADPTDPAGRGSGGPVPGRSADSAERSPDRS